MKNFRRFGIFIICFLLFLYVVIVGFFTTDPDFGWHLRFGQIILSTHQIPKLDLFSYSMPSYHFIDHEWLTDTLIALLFPLIGKIGEVIVFSLITIFSLLIQYKKEYKKFFLMPFFLSGMSLFIFPGIKPQLISLFFFSVILSLFLNESLYNKFKYLLPFLFLFWANLHGGFFIGLGIFALFYITEVIKKKRILIKDFILFFASVVVTLINPYGLSLWKEIFTTIGDAGLRWTIQEWEPSVFFVNIPFFLLLSFSLTLLFKYHNKFNLREKTFFLVLLIFYLSSARNLTFFAVITLFICIKGFALFYKDLGKYKFGKERFIKFYYAFFVISVVFFFLKLIFSYFVILPNYSNNADYPKQAVNFLINNPSKGEVFSIYNWGGYLIWELPSKKVFIDGRMPSWKQKEKANESGNAFKESNELLAGKLSVKNTVLKYNIDTFLLPVASKNPKREPEFIKKIKILNTVIWGNEGYNLLKFQDIIKKNGFKLIYKDSLAQIYRKT